MCCGACPSCVLDPLTVLLTALLAVQVLVVTRSFEQQTAPLNEQDLEATWATVQVTRAACSCHNPS